jgi:uncharacterized protein (TIGR03067 family)
MMVSALCSVTHGQPATASAELERFQGAWRVVELVEDGQSIPQEALKTVLQSGGQAQIVSNTIQFTSRVTGKPVAKVFSIDATTYPKTIAVSSLDRAEALGIYQFEGERLIVCVADPAIAERPTQFSSRPGSRHMLMVLERAEGNASLSTGSPESPLVDTVGPPKAVPQEAPRPATTVIQFETPAQPTEAAGSGNTPAPEVIKVQLPAPPAVAAAPATPGPATPAPTAVAPVPPSTAARVLTDGEVAVMLRGTWRLTDGAGALQVTFDANGTYRTYREVKDPSTFYNVFVKAPVSSGNWSVQNGSIAFHVTSSTDLTRVNQVFHAAVRSISETDFIFVDFVGRVGKAERL